MPGSRALAFISYVTGSFFWLLAMALWPAVILPYIEARCFGGDRVGLLPAGLVVPFAVLGLYVVSVLAHALFSFRPQRFSANAQSSAPSIWFDAAFFLPFTALSIVLLAVVTHWGMSWHCFVTTAVLGLPWLVTPLFNARLIARQRRG